MERRRVWLAFAWRRRTTGEPGSNVRATSSGFSFERHGISRLPEIEGDKPKTKRCANYAIGYLHIDMAEVRTASDFLRALIEAAPYPIQTITQRSAGGMPGTAGLG